MFFFLKEKRVNKHKMSWILVICVFLSAQCAYKNYKIYAIILFQSFSKFGSQIFSHVANNKC